MRALGVDETATIRVTVDPGGLGPRRRPGGAVRRTRRDRGAVRRPRRCCSGTPSTTRRRPCCSAWPAGRWPVAGGDAPARSTVFRSPAARPDPRRHRGGLPGRGHRVLDRPAQQRPAVHPRRGCGTRCCRCSSASSARGWRRRSRARPTSCAPTRTTSTRWRAVGAASRPGPTDGHRPSRRSTTLAPTRSAPGSCAGRGHRGRRHRRRAVPHPRARDRPPGQRLARPEVGRAPGPRHGVRRRRGAAPSAADQSG